MRETLINKIKMGEKITANEMLEAFDRVGETYFETLRDYTPPPFALPITPLERKRTIRKQNELFGDFEQTEKGAKNND